MSSFIPSTIQDKINALITQITNVYKAFIQHTKTFFVDSTGNTTITSNGDINLNSNSNSGYLNINLDNIQINSNNSVSITSDNNLSIGTANSTSNNDLSIVSNGLFFIGSDNNSINLINPIESSSNQLAILWGNNIPTIDTYSVGTLYICTNGNLYIYTNTDSLESPEWKQITISN